MSLAPYDSSTPEHLLVIPQADMIGYPNSRLPVWTHLIGWYVKQALSFLEQETLLHQLSH